MAENMSLYLTGKYRYNFFTINPLGGERKRQMTKEKVLKIRTEEGFEKTVRYYIESKAPEKSEFGCGMYIVGIEEEGERKEIDDFSPSRSEAEELLENLYEKRVTAKALYSAAEAFITGEE